MAPEPLKYADLFEKEAGQHLAALRSIVSELDDAAVGDDERAALVVRLRHESHGLAGVAAAVGLEAITRLMGAVEGASVAVTRSGASPSPALLRAVGVAVDAADVLARGALEGRDPPESPDIDGLIAAVHTGAGMP